jgi:hypothetical protein
MCPAVPMMMLFIGISLIEDGAYVEGVNKPPSQFQPNLLEIRPNLCYIKPIFLNSLDMITQGGRGSGSGLIFEVL